MKKHICIYGGSFDPTTMAHAMVLEKLEELTFIDEIWIVICRYRNHKNLTSYTYREEMFSLLLNMKSEESKKKIFIKDLEYHDKETPTYELLKNQKEKYPEYTFYFCMGSDLLFDIFTWDNGKELVAENNFIIIERGNYEIVDDSILQKFPSYHLIKIEKLTDVNMCSATMVREILNSNKYTEHIDKLLHPLIIKYIEKEGLYELKESILPKD